MTTTRQTLQRSALLAIGVLALTGSPALAQSYVFSDLGTLNGPDPISIPQRINNSGQIVGVIIPTGGENYVPVIWNGTNKTVLDSVPGGVGVDAGRGVEQVAPHIVEMRSLGTGKQ